MYGWFGSKEGLFEAVFAQQVDGIVDAVPFTPYDLPGYAVAKYEAIGQAQREGRIVDSIRPDEVYALIIAIAGTWSPVSGTFTASQEDSEPDHDRRRAALREVIQRALMP